MFMDLFYMGERSLMMFYHQIKFIENLSLNKIFELTTPSLNYSSNKYEFTRLILKIRAELMRREANFYHYFCLSKEKQMLGQRYGMFFRLK